MSFRLVFIVSCLEPGKSGVGDVTRHLAQALGKQGHEVLLISINETSLAEEKAEGGEWRLPSGLTWSERGSKIRHRLKKFSPDLVSIQFVCYGFEPRGMILFLIPYFRDIIEGFPCQIMFHELWLATNQDAAWKEKIVGWLQRQGIKMLIRTLKPRVIHASNPTYVALLKKHGISARELPLPTAVTIDFQRDTTWFYNYLSSRELIMTEDNREKFWLFGFFGTLHPVWPPEPLLTYISDAAAKVGRTPVFLILGNMGAGQSLWERMKLDYKNKCHFIEFGMQPENRVSHFFHEIDYAIATTPWEILGKSSSAVTMQEHGVPVIVNRQMNFGVGTDRLIYDDPLLIRMDEQLPEILERGMARRVPQERSPEVARRFLVDCLAET